MTILRFRHVFVFGLLSFVFTSNGFSQCYIYGGDRWSGMLDFRACHTGTGIKTRDGIE